MVGIFLGTLSVIQLTFGTYDNDYGGYALSAIQNISGQINDYRRGRTVGDPNIYAQMMLVMVSLALDRLWHKQKKALQFFAAWAFGVCSFSIVLTYSRGGFLSMLVVVIAMVAFLYSLAAALFSGCGNCWIVNDLFLPPQFTQRLRHITELVRTPRIPLA